MIPELQKGRCYYRCQRQGCPTTTIREDRLEEAIRYRLHQLQITPDHAKALETHWIRDAADKQIEDTANALRLQIADEQARLERLTDLLVDSAIDQDTYRERQRQARLRAAELQEQLSDIPDQEQIARQRRGFLELMKSLCLLYKMADSSEKREIVENAFSNRLVAGKNVELEPYDWLKRTESALPVLNCGPERYRDTDLPSVPAGVQNLERLLALMKR